MNARARRNRRKPAAIGCLGVGILVVVGLVGLGAIVGESPESESAASGSVAGEEHPTPTPAPRPTPGPAPEDESRFVAVIDGDTIETSAGTVRLIGIDTPERGECGYRDASLALSQMLAPGDLVVLVLPPGQRDRDRHGRLLRSAATADGRDLGLAQIEAGHAVARYDSRDGYPAHPAEADYHRLQRAELTVDRTVVSVICGAGGAEAGGEPGPEAGLGSGAAPGGGGPLTGTDPAHWYLAYPSCAALKRNTVGDPVGPFHRDDPAQADAYRWFQDGTGHRGDGDGDGWACE